MQLYRRTKRCFGVVVPKQPRSAQIKKKTPGLLTWTAAFAIKTELGPYCLEQELDDLRNMSWCVEGWEG